MTIASIIMAAALVLAAAIPFLARKARAAREGEYEAISVKADELLAQIQALRFDADIEAQHAGAQANRVAAAAELARTVQWSRLVAPSARRVGTTYEVRKVSAALVHDVEAVTSGADLDVPWQEEALPLLSKPRRYRMVAGKTLAKARREDVGWQPRECFRIN